MEVDEISASEMGASSKTRQAQMGEPSKNRQAQMGKSFLPYSALEAPPSPPSKKKTKCSLLFYNGISQSMQNLKF